MRRRRKRIGSSSVDGAKAYASTVVWTEGFQFDVDESGRAIKIFSIIDEHTREYVGGLVERSITADQFSDHLGLLYGLVTSEV